MIEALNYIFATHGFPAILVSDNGPQFTSSGFEDFLLENNITHLQVTTLSLSLEWVGRKYGQEC